MYTNVVITVHVVTMSTERVIQGAAQVGKGAVVKNVGKRNIYKR